MLKKLFSGRTQKLVQPKTRKLVKTKTLTTKEKAAESKRFNLNFHRVK
jgi:hypothetical protein